MTGYRKDRKACRIRGRRRILHAFFVSNDINLDRSGFVIEMIRYMIYNKYRYSKEIIDKRR